MSLPLTPCCERFIETLMPERRCEGRWQEQHRDAICGRRLLVTFQGVPVRPFGYCTPRLCFAAVDAGVLLGPEEAPAQDLRRIPVYVLPPVGDLL